MNVAVTATGRTSELRPGEKSAVLAVSFSSSARYAFYRMHITTTTLFLAETESYYVRDITGLNQQIIDTAKDVGASKVLLMGISKGAWAAIKCATMLCDEFEKLGVIAFSPMLRLYPHNPALHFGSYQRMMRQAQTDEGLRDWLERYGFVSGNVSNPNLSIDLYYSAKNATDVGEADRIGGSSINKIPVPLSVHPCHLPYVTDCTDETAIRKQVQASIDKAAISGDIGLEEAREQAVAEMLAMGPQPSAESIVRQAIGRLEA